MSMNLAPMPWGRWDPNQNRWIPPRDTSPFPHEYESVGAKVHLRRQLRKLDVSRLCVALDANVKNIIWRFLPKVSEDTERERVLHFVKQTRFRDKDWSWFFQIRDRDSRRINRHTYLDDQEIMMTCMQHYPANQRALMFCSSRLRQKKEIVLASVTNNGYSLQYADSYWQYDREVVLAALENEGRALQYADRRFKKDKFMVRYAVERCGAAIRYAECDYDRDIVLAAVSVAPAPTSAVSLVACSIFC